MRWPNVVKMAVVYLKPALGGVRVVTRLPSSLEPVLPLVRVRRGPGSDDGITDSPLLDVEGFTAVADEDAMWDLAEDIRQAVHDMAGMDVGGFLVDSVETSVGPTDLDYGNPAVARTVASYRLHLRKIQPTP